MFLYANLLHREKKTTINLSFEKNEWNIIIFIYNAQISVLKSVFLVETLPAQLYTYMYIDSVSMLNWTNFKIARGMMAYIVCPPLGCRLATSFVNLTDSIIKTLLNSFKSMHHTYIVLYRQEKFISIQHLNAYLKYRYYPLFSLILTNDFH